MIAMKPLYVRLPTAEADKLDRAAFELKTTKQDLVANLIRRFTIETQDDAMAVGHAAFRPFSPPDVLTVADLSSWLQVSEDAVTELAEQGDLPGRKLAGEWRFAREAILDWLAQRQ
jgi:excisionase family DNA binding protein